MGNRNSRTNGVNRRQQQGRLHSYAPDDDNIDWRSEQPETPSEYRKNNTAAVTAPPGRERTFSQVLKVTQQQHPPPQPLTSASTSDHHNHRDVFAQSPTHSLGGASSRTGSNPATAGHTPCRVTGPPANSSQAASSLGLATNTESMIKQIVHFFKVGSTWSGSLLFVGWETEVEMDMAITDYDRRSNTLLGYRTLGDQYDSVTIKVFKASDPSVHQIYVTVRDTQLSFLAAEVNLVSGSVSGTVRGNNQRGYFALQRMGDTNMDILRAANQQSSSPQQVQQQQPMYTGYPEEYAVDMRPSDSMAAAYLSPVKKNEMDDLFRGYTEP